MKTPTSERRIYLDFASSTPVDKEVENAMAPYYSQNFGNPGALHEEGRVAKEAVEKARKEIGEILGCREREIVFTSGGTESNVLGIMGVVNYLEKEEGLRHEDMHIITSAIEHPSAFATCKELERQGVKTSFIGVSSEGVLNVDELKEALRENTVLVSVMYANNEIGTIQPIREIAEIIKEHRKKHTLLKPFFHIDASQVPSYLDITVDRLGVDLMSLDAQKIYGPKGVGVLYKREGVGLSPLFPGGRQEWGMRTGTENIPAIVGIAEALKKVTHEREQETLRVEALRDFFIDAVLERIEGATLNGDPIKRIANNANFYIPGVDNEWLVVSLDVKGISIGSKSACQPPSVKNSHVVLALGRDKKHAQSSFRFTFGRTTTKEELERTIEIMSHVISKARVNTLVS